MNIKLSVICLLFLIVACTKGKDNEENTDNPGGSYLELKTDDIDLSPYKFSQGYDTTGNYIATYGFKLNYETQGWFTATTDPARQNYYFKYVGGVPLISPDTYKYNNGELMKAPINATLKGKLIFEVYKVSDNSLFRKVIASPDSCYVTAKYSVWANNSITPDSIRSAFHYYMTVKQTPNIKYHN